MDCNQLWSEILKLISKSRIKNILRLSRFKLLQLLCNCWFSLNVLLLCEHHGNLNNLDIAYINILFHGNIHTTGTWRFATNTVFLLHAECNA